jgi:hypothetical protein
MLDIASGSGQIQALAKDFLKVKTYSDLIVLKQDAHDKLGEPARWVLYTADFDTSQKSSYGQSSSAAMDEYVLDPRPFNLL